MIIYIYILYIIHRIYIKNHRHIGHDSRKRRFPGRCSLSWPRWKITLRGNSKRCDLLRFLAGIMGNYRKSHDKWSFMAGKIIE